MAISNYGPDSRIDAEMRVKGSNSWESPFTFTNEDSQIDYKEEDDKYLYVGESIKGVIHSIEITTSNGELRIDQQQILSTSHKSHSFSLSSNLQTEPLHWGSCHWLH